MSGNHEITGPLTEGEWSALLYQIPDSVRALAYKLARFHHAVPPDRRSKSQLATLVDTAEALASDYGVHRATIIRDGKRAEFFERLLEEGEAGLVPEHDGADASAGAGAGPGGLQRAERGLGLANL